MDRSRLDALVRELREQKLDAMLICPGEELLFFTGFTPMMCERFQGLFVGADGSMIYICNLIYRAEIEQNYAGMKIYSWRDGESMTDVVDLALGVSGLGGGVIGVNTSAQAYNLLDIATDCGVKFTNGRAALQEARIIKSPDEQDALRRIAKITDDAFEAVLGFIKPGKTEGEILSFLTEFMVSAGAENPWGIVAAGANSAFPHYLGRDGVVGERDVLLLDFGATYKGLFSDMSRVVFTGGISDEEKRIYETVLEANLKAEAKAVNGAFIPDVDAAARDVIAKAGYGDYFINRLGHGVGYMIHEAPDIRANNRRSLKPGMVFSIEPGVNIEGKFGMRVEDVVLVTEDGNEVLNKAAKDIIIL